MTVSIREIIEGQQIPNANTTLYTSPASVWTRIESVSVANPTGSPATYSLWLVASGGSAGNTNVLTSAQSVLAGQTIDDQHMIGKVLNPGDFIVGYASAGTTLTIHASGIQQS